MSRISETERRRIFGNPCGRYQTVVTPWNLSVICHPLLVDRFRMACDAANIQSAWKPRRIDSYNCRTIRGSSAYSLHAYGLAWDFFDRPYPQPVDVWGPANAPDLTFRNAFKRLGFSAGADFVTRVDYPHIEWADGQPGIVPAADPAPSPSYVRVVASQEVDMVVTDIDVGIPTDGSGNGWTAVPYQVDKIVGFLAPGLRPAADGHYESCEVGFAQEDPNTIVSVIGWAPGTTAVVRLRVVA